MANPILNTMSKERILEGEPMTINGTITKTYFLLACLLFGGIVNYHFAISGFTDRAGMLTLGGLVVGTILAFVIIFTRKALNILTPVYSFAEGLLLGGISAVYAGEYSGIVTQAVIATLAVLGVMLACYGLKLIQCTDKFRSVIITATLSVAVIYLIEIIANLFGRGIPAIFGSGAIGIGFSLIVVAIAALNLIVDFDFIERGSQNLLEKKYEWYGAFGLMVSLIWLYLEVLKLIAKLNRR